MPRTCLVREVEEEPDAGDIGAELWRLEATRMRKRVVASRDSYGCGGGSGVEVSRMMDGETAKPMLLMQGFGERGRAKLPDRFPGWGNSRTVHELWFGNSLMFKLQLCDELSWPPGLY